MNGFDNSFKDFDRQFEKGFKQVKRTATTMIIVAVVGNLIFWGGLIAVGFWCLKHFGFI